MMHREAVWGVLLVSLLGCRPTMYEPVERWGGQQLFRVIVELGPMTGDTEGLSRYWIRWSQTWADRIASRYPETPLPLITSAEDPVYDVHDKYDYLGDVPRETWLTEGDTIFDFWFDARYVRDTANFPETLYVGWFFFDVCNALGCEPNWLQFERPDGTWFPDTAQREYVLFREGWVSTPGVIWPREEMFFKPFRRTDDVVVFRVPLQVRDSPVVQQGDTFWIKVVNFSWHWEAVRGAEFLP